MENISFDECLIDKGRETTDDFLAHHGILGMKWGVRKDGKPQGWQGGKGKKAAKAVGSGTKKVAKGTARAVSRGYGKARELNYRRIEKEQLKEAIKNDRKLENQRIASRDIALTTRSARTLSKHMNSLTDAELQQRINRLQKENQVREMAAAERERGRSWVSKSLEKSAKKSVENLTTYGITKAGKTAIDGFLDEVGKQSAKDSDKPSYSTTSTKSSSGNYTSTDLLENLLTRFLLRVVLQEKLLIGFLLLVVLLESLLENRPIRLLLVVLQEDLLIR